MSLGTGSALVASDTEQDTAPDTARLGRYWLNADRWQVPKYSRERSYAMCRLFFFFQYIGLLRLLGQLGLPACRALATLLREADVVCLVTKE